MASPLSSLSSTSRRTSLPSSFITEKVTRAGSERSKPSCVLSAYPSPLGENSRRLGGEAYDQRELALQLLRGKEGGDRRKHEQREHHSDEGPGHAGGNLVAGVTDTMSAMRVQLIDPSGDVAPYDHALAAALAARGAAVELVTSRFVHGPAAEPDGYSVDRHFYRLATRIAADAHGAGGR